MTTHKALQGVGRLFSLLMSLSIILTPLAAAQPAAVAALPGSGHSGPVTATAASRVPDDGKPPAGVPPNITIVATLQDSLLVDNNNNSLADPGDTLRYTAVIANTGTADATGTAFNDNLDANTTLSGAVKTTPLAVADAYSALGNVGIDVPAGSGLLANDFGLPAPTAVAASGISLQGGAFNVAADGSFTYNPPTGYTGSDSFTYTATNANGNDTGTVTINVSGRIWFIDNNPGACASACDGRLSNPFTGLAAFNAVNTGSGTNPGDNDPIFLYESATAYSGPAMLRNGQKLIGQDATSSLATLAGVSPPAFSDPLPIMNGGNGTLAAITSAGNDVTLAQNNSLYGFTAGNAGGTAVSGTSFGSLVVQDVTVNSNGAGLSLSSGSFGSPAAFTSLTSSGGTNNVSLSNVTGSGSLGSGALSGASGNAFDVNGGNGSVTYNGTIANSAARSVSIQNKTGGSVTLGGAVSGTGSGVLLNGNSGASISFSGGGMNLNTGSNTAFSATGGGTVNVTGANNVLNTTTVSALNVANTTIGGSGLTFQSISANGASSGIVLNNTGSSGGLTVTGTGGAGSGGTIQNTGSHGILLTGTFSPSFNNMTIQTTAGSGVKGTGVTNFSFTNGSIDNSGTGLGLDASNIAFNTTAAGTENNLAGTVTINNNSLTNAYYHGIDIFNYDGTLSNVTLSGNTITSATSTATSKGSGIRLIAYGSASTIANVTKATITNNIISNFPSNAGIQAQSGNANAGGSPGTFGIPNDGTNIIAITGNRIAGLSPANYMGTNAILTSVNGKGQGNFDISGNGTVANPLTNIGGTVISNSAFGQTTVTSNIANNIIVANNFVASQGIGIGVDNTFGLSDAPALTARITNNDISQTDGNGILATARNSNGTANFIIQNNTVGAPTAGVRPGIRIDSGSSSGNTTVCLNISGNSSAGSGGVQGIGLRKQGTVPTTNAFAVNGMGATSSPGVEAYVNGLNPAGGGTLLISATSGFSNCSLTAPDGPAAGMPPAEAADQAAAAARITVPAAAAPATNPTAAKAPASMQLRSRSAAGTPARKAGPAAPIPTVNIGTLPAGKSITVVFDVTINNPTPAGVTQVSTQGTVSGSNFSPVVTDDPDTGTPNDPTVTPLNIEADLQLSKSATPSIVIPGRTVTYTLVYTNAGPQIATGVTIADLLPAELTNPSYQSTPPVSTSGPPYTFNVGDLGIGAGGTITIVATVTNTAAANTVITNTAGISGSTVDTLPGNNSQAAAVQTSETTRCALTTGSYAFNSTLPVDLTVTGAGTIDCISVQRTDANHPDAAPGETTGHYWTIAALDGSGNPATGYSVDLTLPATVTLSGNEVVCRYVGSPQQWDCAATSVNTGSSTVTRDGISELSDWAVGDPDLGRLVTLIGSFSAIAVSDHISVTWQTVSEIGNTGFNLWRGTTPAAPDTQLNSSLIPSQSPGSTQGYDYEWQDNYQLVSGTTYYYWLDTVDVNGGLERYGPMSALYTAPLAVRLGGLTAATPQRGVPVLGLALLLLGGALLVSRRRRERLTQG